MRHEQMYSLAIRERAGEDDFFWKEGNFRFREIVIENAGDYWFADPFLFQNDGQTYIFYEAFDLVGTKGKIGYSKYLGKGRASAPTFILDEPYHLSFPFIFKQDGEIYMMPETCGDYRVKLYRAVDFPNVWEPAQVIIDDIYACDSVIFQRYSERYLLVNRIFHNTPNGQDPACWMRNRLYELDGFTLKDDGVTVAEGDHGIRNAGKMFEMDGKLLRIGQDCTRGEYGRGLVLNDVEKLSPYCETVVWSKDCDDFAPHIDLLSKKYPINGVHTYNFCDDFEIIDFSQHRAVRHKVMRERKKLFYSKKLKGILRRIGIRV